MPAESCQPIKRYVEGHVQPDVPARHQYYACERPEDDAVYAVLWHSECHACMIALAASLQQGGVIVMAHGMSLRC